MGILYYNYMGFIVLAYYNLGLQTRGTLTIPLKFATIPWGDQFTSLVALIWPHSIVSLVKFAKSI